MEKETILPGITVERANRPVYRAAEEVPMFIEICELRKKGYSLGRIAKKLRRNLIILYASMQNHGFRNVRELDKHLGTSCRRRSRKFLKGTAEYEKQVEVLKKARAARWNKSMERGESVMKEITYGVGIEKEKDEAFTNVLILKDSIIVRRQSSEITITL